MIDTQLLDEKIALSGLRISFIVENLGISRQAFDKKRKGLSKFRIAEIYVLADLLKLTLEEKIKIFYPKS